MKESYCSFVLTLSFSLGANEAAGQQTCRLVSLGETNSALQDKCSHQTDTQPGATA